MMRYMHTAAAAAIALAMGTSAGVAQEATTFDIDHDATGGASGAAFEDFNKGFTEFGLFDRWDTDRDEFLTQDEFAAGVYGVYDVDRDAQLTQDEVVGMGEDRLFDGAPNAWFVWENDEQRLPQQDFTTGFRNWETYGTWDADQDSMLSRDEFNRGIFVRYDVDQDETLSEAEIEAMREDRIFTY